ncbi:MAG TPA: CerR family C-terminal domain-containing protein [Steroidobacteraceae bacterium]|nr:CerR family C-terminal domain-containing protein [Steroidobacteraceae bacterium]HRX88501.1 CerR family C-terminal domain-containing protein [Steroidobacteraceae bacterium]
MAAVTERQSSATVQQTYCGIRSFNTFVYTLTPPHGRCRNAARAGTNLNTVNYYYGSKRALYLEAMRTEFARSRSRAGSGRAALAASTLEARLYDFVLDMLTRLLDSLSLLPRLTALEILNPSPAFDELIATAHAREQDALTLLVRETLGPAATSDLVDACVRSVLAQCVYYLFMRDALRRSQLELPLDRAAAARLARHITAFSLAAMRGFANSST